MPELCIAGPLTAARFQATEKAWEESPEAAWTPGAGAARRQRDPARVRRWTGKAKSTSSGLPETCPRRPRAPTPSNAATNLKPREKCWVFRTAKSTNGRLRRRRKRADMEPKPIPYHDLMRALTPDAEIECRACPICQLVAESVVRYLDDLIFFSAVKPDIRAEIRAARGFCNEHASQLAQLVGKGLGVALIHEDIIDTVMEGLAQAVPPRPSRPGSWPQ